MKPAASTFPWLSTATEDAELLALAVPLRVCCQRRVPLRSNFATVKSSPMPTFGSVKPAASTLPWLSTATEDASSMLLLMPLRFCCQSRVPLRSNFATVKSSTCRHFGATADEHVSVVVHRHRARLVISVGGAVEILLPEQGPVAIELRHREVNAGAGIPGLAGGEHVSLVVHRHRNPRLDCWRCR